MSPAAKEKEAAPTRHKKIGPYRVLQELGRGGMGVVYRGVHELLQREVAIKELLPESRDNESQSRFRREALALAAFRHQSIVSLYDLVEKGESQFMILEFVDGPTLAELLRDGPLPPEVAAVIGARIAAALEHAHFFRVIHRDIKPGNVMITKSGEVKLMDFGIAKDEGMAALTRQGVAIGTPAYMSPEQVTGAKIDGRTDLFALGTVLYECLAGGKPFTGQTAGEVFAKIRDGKCAPIAKAAAGTPKALAEIVGKAMRTRPEKRYQEALHLRRDLESFAARQVSLSHNALLVAFLRHREKITETEALAHLSENVLTLAKTFHPRQRRRRRNRLRWALAALVALGGGGAWYAHTHPHPKLSQLKSQLQHLAHPSPLPPGEGQGEGHSSPSMK